MVRFICFLAFVVTISCVNNGKSSEPISESSSKVRFDSLLMNELIRLAEIDQTAAGLPLPRYGGFTDEWKVYKDSVYRSNQTYLKVVLEKHDFPGYDLVGDAGTNAFWLMVQHCDFDVEFQQSVLVRMKKELDRKNADAANYAYLTDRVRMNRDEKLVYGTQVIYNTQTGQAMSYPLMDSINVNKRRAEVGLESLEVYLNEMSESHFWMNKDNMKARGIEAPTLYPIPLTP